MRTRTLVDATDLDRWAQRLDAQAALPKLVRRLVRATVEHVVFLDLPAGEGVQTPGWDGIVAVDRGNASVPDGVSAWELSTRKDTKNKADEDYTKRTADPLGVDPAQTAFIFVTPKRWAGKASWQNARQDEGVWREVRAYDADDLEVWLESAPSVHIWFSIALGKHPASVIDLESWWDDWATATVPPLPPALLTAGRSEAAQKAGEWISGESATAALQSDTCEEALAFYASVLQQFPVEQREQELARTVVVSDPADWKMLSTSENALTLIPRFANPDVGQAVRGRHRVVVPLGRSDSTSGTTIAIPRISRDEAEAAFISQGIDRSKARELATLVRRSLTSCRRKLATRPEVHQPKWAQPAEAQALLPFLLAGSWNAGIEGDRQALAALAHGPYDEAALVRWSNEADPPVRHIGDAWYLVSKEDSWSLLARYLTSHDLDTFRTVCIDVLGAPDPRFDFAEDERYKARVLGPDPRHSDLLREGLADTLAVMGARGDAINAAGATARDHAARIVRQLLELAVADWRILSSLASVMPLLAEAAPDEFLSAVDGGLVGESPVVLTLFAKNDCGTFVTSQHTGLLWALEGLAWSPDHLSRATLTLGKLARLDPGGKLHNRPENSLREIFLLWHPQTAASLDQRLAVLDLLCERESHLAWSLLLGILPDSTGFAQHTATPLWREWAPDDGVGVTDQELEAGVREVTMRALSMLGVSGQRWCKMLAILSNLTESQRNAAISQLDALGADAFSHDDRMIIWSELRGLLSSHRSYPDAAWALPQEGAEQLAAVYARFEPDDLLSAHAWLFASWPNLPEGRESDPESQEEAAAAAQSSAIELILAKLGLPGVLGLIPRVENPLLIGYRLGQTELEKAEDDRLLMDHLGSEDPRCAEFARGLVMGRMQSHGQAWTEAKCAALFPSLSPRQRAHLLFCLPCDEATWARAEGAGPETYQEYWRAVPTYGVRESAALAAKQLMDCGRPYATVQLLWYCRDREALPHELIAEALERVLQASPESEGHIPSFPHYVSELLDTLESSDGVDEHRLAALEWAFIPLLSRRDREPRVLHSELSRSPKFFAEIVALVYRAQGEQPRDLSPDEQARCTNAWRLLQSWRAVPGTQADGTIDGVALARWMEEARQLLAAQGRAKIGDQMIGHALSGSPQGEDGAWPNVDVRNTIEAVASEDLEQGLELGVYNSRGVVSKSLSEGGRQEWQLSEQYSKHATIMRDRWPRTAQMLRRLANRYEAEARREDAEAELRQDLDR